MAPVLVAETTGHNRPGSTAAVAKVEDEVVGHEGAEAGAEGLRPGAVVDWGVVGGVEEVAWV